MINFKVVLKTLLNAVYTSSSGGSSAGLDLQNYAVNPITLLVSARTGGTATTTVTVEHSSDDGSTDTYTAIPASALYDLNTGLAATFGTFSTTVYSKALGVNTQQIKRYIRVTFAGTSITQNVAVVAGLMQDYTETTATF